MTNFNKKDLRMNSLVCRDLAKFPKNEYIYTDQQADLVLTLADEHTNRLGQKTQNKKAKGSDQLLRLSTA